MMILKLVELVVGDRLAVSKRKKERKNKQTKKEFREGYGRLSILIVVGQKL